MNHGTYAALYDRGIAVGHSRIDEDAIDFRWKDELFTFDAKKVLWCGVAHHNGYFYEAPVEKLRKLQHSHNKEKKNG